MIMRVGLFLLFLGLASCDQARYRCEIYPGIWVEDTGYQNQDGTITVSGRPSIAFEARKCTRVKG